jgi:hypothetical protein
MILLIWIKNNNKIIKKKKKKKRMGQRTSD